MTIIPGHLYTQSPLLDHGLCGRGSEYDHYPRPSLHSVPITGSRGCVGVGGSMTIIPGHLYTQPPLRVPVGYYLSMTSAYLNNMFIGT